MFMNFFRTRWMRGAFLFLATTLPVAQALELGTVSMATVPARSMQSVAFSTSKAGFTRFALKVGGVAFTTTASSADGSSVTALRYDSTAADGKRLIARLRLADGSITEHAVPAPDWIHVPLARLVQSGDTGAVTLFGELQDKQQEAKMRESDAMIANYHPALANTLLGLRLIHADMLVIEKNATDLFTEKGKYILGEGEKAPTAADLKANHASYMAVKNWVTKQPLKFSSYVTGDIGSRITYAAKGKELALSGDPTWYCWRHDSAQLAKLQNAKTRTMSPDAFALWQIGERETMFREEAAKLLKGVQGAGEDQHEARDLAILLKAKAAADKRMLGSLLGRAAGKPAPLLFDPVRIKQVLATGDGEKLAAEVESVMAKVKQLAQTDDKRFDSVLMEFRQTRQEIETESASLNVIQMPDYTSKISAVIKKKGGINPTVYKALKTSVQVAALMRAAKLADPDAFKRFVASVAAVQPGAKLPAGFAVKTPTVYPRSE